MAQAEQALQRLYEDADLRGDLRDTEAESLLKWAEAQVARLAEQVTDEAQFEAQFDVLRGMLKDMNRLVGRRSAMDADAQAAKLGEITAAAQALGAPVTVQAQTPPDWQAMDDSAALNTLIEMVSPTAAQATPAPPSAQSSAPAPMPAPSSTPAPLPAPVAPPGVTSPASGEDADSDMPAETMPDDSGAGDAPTSGEDADSDMPAETVPDDSGAGDAPASGEDADSPKNRYPGRTPLYPFPTEKTESDDETQF